MSEGRVVSGEQAEQTAAIKAAAIKAAATEVGGRNISVFPTEMVDWLCDICDKIANFFRPLDGRTVEIVEPRRGRLARELDELTSQLTAVDPGNLKAILLDNSNEILNSLKESPSRLTNVILRLPPGDRAELLSERSNGILDCLLQKQPDKGDTLNLAKVFAGEPSDPSGENVIFSGITDEARQGLLDALEPKYLPLAFSFLDPEKRKELLLAQNGIVARLTAPPNPSNPRNNNIEFLVYILTGFNLNGKIYPALESEHLAEVLQHDNCKILNCLQNSLEHLVRVLSKLTPDVLARVCGDNPGILNCLQNSPAHLAEVTLRLPPGPRMEILSREVEGGKILGHLKENPSRLQNMLAGVEDVGQVCQLLAGLDPEQKPIALSGLSSEVRRDVLLHNEGAVTVAEKLLENGNIKFGVNALKPFEYTGATGKKITCRSNNFHSEHLAEVLKHGDFAILKLLADFPALLDAVLKQLELKELATMIDNPTVLGYVKRNISRLSVAEEIDRLEPKDQTNLLNKLDDEHWTNLLPKLDDGPLANLLLRFNDEHLTKERSKLLTKALLRLKPELQATVLENNPKIAEGLGKHLSYVLTNLNPELRAKVLLKKPELLNSLKKDLLHVLNGGIRNRGDRKKEATFKELELGGYKEVLKLLDLKDQAKVLAGRNPRDLAEVLQDDDCKILNDLAASDNKELLDTVLDRLPVGDFAAMTKNPVISGYLKRHISRLAEVRNLINQNNEDVFQALIKDTELENFVDDKILEALGEGDPAKLASSLNGSTEAVREAALRQREVVNCLQKNPADFAQAYAGRILKAVPGEGEAEAAPEAGEAAPEAGKVEKGVSVGLTSEKLWEVVNDKDNGVLKYLIDHAKNRRPEYLLKVSAALKPEDRIVLLNRPEIKAYLEKKPEIYKMFLVGFKSRDGINYGGFSTEELGPLLAEDKKILEFFSNQGNESPQYLYNLLTGLDRETATQMLKDTKILDCFRRDLAFSLQKFQFSRGDPSCLSRTIVHFGKDAETMVTNEVVDILKEDPSGLAGVFVLLTSAKRQEVCERLTGRELSAMLASIPKDDNGILFETLKHGPNLGKLMTSGVEFENLASMFSNLEKADFNTIVKINCGNPSTQFGEHLRTRCNNFKPRKDNTKISLQVRLSKKLGEAGFPVR